MSILCLRGGGISGTGSRGFERAFSFLFFGCLGLGGSEWSSAGES